MIIGVAGPYSAPTAEQRKVNLEAMNKAAAEVYQLGHIPFIGINVSVPVVDQMKFETQEERYDATMKISLALIDKCDALLVITHLILNLLGVRALAAAQLGWRK